MREDLIAAAQGAVELAKKAGADEVFAHASRSREVSFQLRDGALEEVKDATSRSLSIELWAGGKYSTHQTNDLRPDRLQSFVTEAVAITRALQPDPFRAIPDPALFAGRASVDLQLVDGGIGEMTREERIALCEAQYGVIKGADRLISATCGTQDGHAITADASSNGFSGVQEQTWLWIGSEVTLRDEGDARAESYMWGGAANRSDVPGAEWVARRALEQTQARLGSTKGPTTRATMIVDPQAAPSLISRLLSPANAASVQQQRSVWAGKVGQKLLSDKLVVTDEPLLPRGLASRLYDGEGIAAKSMPVVKDGALQALYVDTYYGKKLGMAPTTGSPSNRVVGLGDKDLAGLLAAAGSGIYVTSWLGGNTDPTTGDYSFGLRGHLVENGRIGAPIGEMNITGNLLELFAHLAAVGNDPWKWSSILAPTLVFEDVQFSGA